MPEAIVTPALASGVVVARVTLASGRRMRCHSRDATTPPGKNTSESSRIRKTNHHSNPTVGNKKEERHG
jgi:hypothetical protein